MKILHLAPIKGERKSDGEDQDRTYRPPEGISVSVPKLALAQCNSGKKVGVISSYPSFSQSSEIYWNDLSDYKISSFFSRRKYNHIINNFGLPDFLNIHDIYNLKQIFFSLHFVKKKVKIFVTPRGTFSEVALSRSKFKKKFFLYFYKIFAHFIFSFIALNKNEKDQIKKIFPHKKIIIIGNGVDYSESRNKLFLTHHEEKLSNEFIHIGFLGRFDIHIKGLDLLLKSYLAYQKKEKDIRIKLFLLGEHRVREFDSKKFIEDIMLDLPHPEMLDVSGPYYGLSKWEELAKLDILIQPSRTEGMPNTVLEAMSSGIPCAVSPSTNVGDLITEANAGWIVDSTEEDLLAFFIKAQDLDKKRLMEIGNNAKKYTKENLTWDNIGKINYL